MIKYEYKIEYIFHLPNVMNYADKEGNQIYIKNTVAQLNKCGADGWELIQISDDVISGSPDGYAVFKRKKL